MTEKSYKPNFIIRNFSFYFSHVGVFDSETEVLKAEIRLKMPFGLSDSESIRLRYKDLTRQKAEKLKGRMMN